MSASRASEALLNVIGYVTGVQKYRETNLILLILKFY